MLFNDKNSKIQKLGKKSKNDQKPSKREENRNRFRQFKQNRDLLNRKYKLSDSSPILDPADESFTIFVDSLISKYLKSARGTRSAKMSLLYISFLEYELKNHILSLIYCFKLTTPNQQFLAMERQISPSLSLKQRIILENYKKIIKKSLTEIFSKSSCLLANGSFFEVLEYQKELSHAERLFTDVIESRIEFYNALTLDQIEFRRLIKLGSKIARTQKHVERSFEALFRANKTNTRLLCLYANYRLNIKNEGFMAIHRLKELRSIASDRLVGAEFLADSSFFSLHLQRNIYLFCGISGRTSTPGAKINFQVDRFSSNAAPFFEYKPQEFTKIDINRLMPEVISKQHNGYIKDYLNQKDSKITQIGAMTTFAVTKTKTLKKIYLLTKLDYLLADDVYVCSLIVPAHQEGLDYKISLILDEKGYIQAMSRRAKMVLGSRILDYQYLLYYLMPGLVNLVRNQKNEEKNFSAASGDTQRGKQIYFARREETMFVFNNMSSPELLKMALLDNPAVMTFRPSPDNYWDVGTLDEAEAGGRMDWIMNFYRKNRLKFLSNFGMVKKVTVYYEKIRYKNGVVLKHIELDNFKKIQRHHIRFLRTFGRNLDKKPSFILAFDPENLSCVRRLLKKRQEIDNLVLRLFKSIARNKLMGLVNGLIPPVRGMLSFNSRLSETEIDKTEREIFQKFNPKIYFSGAEFDSGEVGEGVDEAEMSEESSVFDPVTYRAEHSIKPIPTYRRKKFGWKGFGDSKGSKECSGTKDTDEEKLREAKNPKIDKMKKLEFEQKNDSKVTKEGLGTSRGPRGKHKTDVLSLRRAGKRFSFIECNFKKSVSNKLGLVNSIAGTIIGGEGPNGGLPGLCKGLIQGIAQHLRTSIGDLNNQIRSMENEGKASKVDELMRNFKKNELKRIFETKREEDFPKENTKKMPKNEFLGSRAPKLKVPSPKGGRRPRFDPITSPEEPKNKDFPILASGEEPNDSALSIISQDLRPPSHLRGASQNSSNPSENPLKGTEDQNPKFTKNAQKYHNEDNDSSDLLSLDPNGLNNKKPNSQGSVQSVIDEAFNKQIRSALSQFSLKKVVGNKPIVFYLLLLLIVGAGIYLKIQKDAELKNVVISTQSAIKLCWPIVSTGKLYRLLVRNKMVIAGLINVSISDKYPGYTPFLYPRSWRNFEASKFSQVPNGNDDTHTGANMLKYKNNGVWSDRIELRMVNKSVEGGLEVKETSLGNVMNILLSECWRFSKSFQKKSQLFKDFTQLETDAFVKNTAVMDLKILEKMDQIFDNQKQVWISILRNTVIDFVSSLVCVAFLGIFLWKIVSRIDEEKVKISNFFLKIDRRLIARELVKLNQMLEIRERVLRTGIKLVRVTKKLDLEIEKNFNLRAKSGGRNSKAKLSTQRSLRPSSQEAQKMKIFEIFNNRFNLSKFRSKIKTRSLTLLATILAIIIILNIPLAINYVALTSIKSNIEELSLVKRENMKRLAYNNIAFAIALHKFYRAYKFPPGARKLDPDVLKLESKIAPFFESNYFLEHKSIIERHAKFIYTQYYCVPILPLFKKFKKECKLVSNYKLDYVFPTGFNQMSFYYKELRANAGSDDSLRSAKIWIDEKIALFNLAHSINIDNYLDKTLGGLLLGIDFARLVFIAMFGFCVPLIGVGYRCFYYARKEAEWRGLICTLEVCSDEILVSDGVLRNFFSKKDGLFL